MDIFQEFATIPDRAFMQLPTAHESELLRDNAIIDDRTIYLSDQRSQALHDAVAIGRANYQAIAKWLVYFYQSDTIPSDHFSVKWKIQAELCFQSLFLIKELWLIRPDIHKVADCPEKLWLYYELSIYYHSLLQFSHERTLGKAGQCSLVNAANKALAQALQESCCNKVQSFAELELRQQIESRNDTLESFFLKIGGLIMETALENPKFEKDYLIPWVRRQKSVHHMTTKEKGAGHWRSLYIGTDGSFQLSEKSKQKSFKRIRNKGFSSK